VFQSPRSTLDVRSLDPSPLDFTLSSHRHSHVLYTGLLFISRFIVSQSLKQDRCLGLTVVGRLVCTSDEVTLTSPPSQSYPPHSHMCTGSLVIVDLVITTNPSYHQTPVCPESTRLNVLCSYVCGTRTGILHLYVRTTLLHHFAFCARVFTILSRTLSLNPTKHGIRAFIFCFFSSSSMVLPTFTSFVNYLTST
jgi:hypothetical protein